jgi:PEP-CTERM motif
MKLVKTLIAVAVAACAINANATLSFSAAAAAGSVSGGPLTFNPGAINTVANAVGSVINVRTTPMGLSATDPYSVISLGGSAVLSFGTPVTSFSFLWGSPDAGNTLDISTSTGLEAYTGTQFKTLVGATGDGLNSFSRVFTMTGSTGQTINSITFKSSNIAFEVATAPIPEPETYALMLAGLGAVGFMARRRRSAQASV